MKKSLGTISQSLKGDLASISIKGFNTHIEPYLNHATASRMVKGEDVLTMHPLSMQSQPQSMMYMVCDGHCGVEAAQFVATNFARVLDPKLPAKSPDFLFTKEVEAFADQIKRAVYETFVMLDNEWADMGNPSGTTVTVILVTGALLTVANVGDSATVLDTGCSILELTKSHRIHSNPDEQARLKAAGCELAPLAFHLQGPAKGNEPGVGPIRMWPAGLCVSRSIGDLDAGPGVVPVPHIRQVLLPANGCRLLMASDGLWDVLSFSKAVKITRSKPTGPAATALINYATKDQRCMDDTTLLVLDILPNEGTSFPTIALRTGTKSLNRSPSGRLFACFKPELEEPDSRDAGGHGHLTLYSDVDCLRLYPNVRQQLARSSLGTISSRPAMRGAPDYTLHGGQVYAGFTPGQPTLPKSASEVNISGPSYTAPDPTHHSQHSEHGGTYGSSGGPVKAPSEGSALFDSIRLPGAQAMAISAPQASLLADT